MILDLDNYTEFSQGRFEPSGVDAYGIVTPPNNWDASCPVRTPDKEWICTRDKGHRGPHVASNPGDGETVYAVWDQDRTSWDDEEDDE